MCAYLIVISVDGWSYTPFLLLIRWCLFSIMRTSVPVRKLTGALPRCFATTSTGVEVHPRAKVEKSVFESYLLAFRGYVAQHKVLRESVLYTTIAKFSDYRLGTVIDIENHSRPSILQELADLQHSYNTLLVAHGKCQEDYVNKSTEYDNAKSNLLMRVQPDMEKARGAYYSIKGKFDDAKDQYNSLLQQIQVRKDAQKAQMEYENLKIEIQEGYITDVSNEISKNNDAITRSKEIYGDGDLLTEIMPRLQQMGQKAESRKKNLLISIEEMKRLRDKIVERNDIEERRDASLLKAASDPVSILEENSKSAWDLYEAERSKYNDEKELVDKLEREKNKLASEMAAMASRISLVVNHKFDKSQDISDYNVSMSTVITMINLVVATGGVIYHSHLRSATKQDVESFIASVKRETEIEMEGRDELKELVKKVSELHQSYVTSAKKESVEKVFSRNKESQTTIADGSSTVLRSAPQQPIENEIISDTSIVDEFLCTPNGPAICFLGAMLFFKVLVAA